MTFLRLAIGYLLQTVPFAFLCIYPFRDSLRLSIRATLALTVLLLMALAALFACTGCYLQQLYPPEQSLFQAVSSVFLLLLIPCIIWYVCIVRAVWQKKVFILSFALTCAMVLTAICNAICSNLPLHLDGLPYSIEVILLLPLLYVLALPHLRLLIDRSYRPYADSLSHRESTTLALLTACLFILASGGLSFLDYGSLNQSVSLFLFSSLLMCVVALYVIFFRMIRLTHRQARSQREIQQTRQFLALQQEQYRRILENIHQTRRMRHDFHHHMATIQGYLQEGSPQEAQMYINRYLEQAKGYELTQLCENPTINALVSHYQAQAKDWGISFSVRVDVGASLEIAHEDLAVLLGNLLENAMEAAARAAAGTRCIQVNILSAGKILAITVDNSFDGTVHMSGARYLSTKPQHDGLGLESISEIAARYEGAAEFSHEKNLFHASVMLAT